MIDVEPRQYDPSSFVELPITSLRSENARDIYINNEATLVNALQLDLKSGFDSLVRYYSPYVRKIIEDIVYPDDVDDVAQITFLRAYKALLGYEPWRIKTLKLAGWLRVIAKHAAINQYRENRNREYTFLSLDLFAEINAQLTEDTSANSAIEATRTTTEISREITAYIRTHKHSERNQQIWGLYLRNYSHKEIADHIGCSPAVAGYVIRDIQHWARHCLTSI